MGDASTSQEMPRIAGDHQKLGDSMEQILPLKLQKRTSLGDTLISDFWPPKP